ncbi:MAG: alcohol dehydrogenase [Frankiales bacterium]|nr:alcohol dehydrogenase [Frankiales bacterium]
MTTSSRVAVVIPGTNKLEVMDVTLPDPGPYQVVVEQQASGVCHSQLHQIHSPRKHPVILGHEATGVVLAIGSEVKHVAVGDDVLVTWVPRSPQPEYRPAAAVTLDLPDGTRATSQNVFTWATTTIADEQYIVKAPPGTPKDLGSIIGCAVMTGAGAVLNSAQVKPGESVAVWGVGGVGLSAIAAARQSGANPIIAVDLDDAKLEFAKRFGATLTVNASKGDAVEGVRALTPGERSTDVGGVDHSFDCIGKSITIKQTIGGARSGWWAERRGGSAYLVGVPTEEVTLDVMPLLIGEKRFIGSLGGSSIPEEDFPKFIEWYQKGEFDLDALITERVKLDDINEIVHELEAGKVAGRAILDLS